MRGGTHGLCDQFVFVVVFLMIVAGVDGGLGTYSAKVCGTFESEDDTFSPRRHSIDMAFRPGRTVRQHLSDRKEPLSFVFGRTFDVAASKA